MAKNPIDYTGHLIGKQAIVYSDFEGSTVMDTGTVKATQGMFRVRVDDIWYEVGESTSIILENGHVEMFNAYLG